MPVVLALQERPAADRETWRRARVRARVAVAPAGGEVVGAVRALKHEAADVAVSRVGRVRGRDLHDDALARLVHVERREIPGVGLELRPEGARDRRVRPLEVRALDLDHDGRVHLHRPESGHGDRALVERGAVAGERRRSVGNAVWRRWDETRSGRAVSAHGVGDRNVLRPVPHATEVARLEGARLLERAHRVHDVAGRVDRTEATEGATVERGRRAALNAERLLRPEHRHAVRRNERALHADLERALLRVGLAVADGNVHEEVEGNVATRHLGDVHVRTMAWAFRHARTRRRHVRHDLLHRIEFTAEPRVTFSKLLVLGIHLPDLRCNLLELFGLNHGAVSLGGGVRSLLVNDSPSTDELVDGGVWPNCVLARERTLRC